MFTAYERRLNPHFDKAGTSGALLEDVIGDIARRRAGYAKRDAAFNPADFGDPVDLPS